MSSEDEVGDGKEDEQLCRCCGSREDVKDKKLSGGLCTGCGAMVVGVRTLDSFLARLDEDVADPMSQHLMFVHTLLLLTDTASSLTRTLGPRPAPEYRGEVDRAFGRLRRRAKELMAWIQNPVYAPTHPYGREVMRECKGRFTASAESCGASLPPPTSASGESRSDQAESCMFGYYYCTSTGMQFAIRLRKYMDHKAEFQRACFTQVATSSMSLIIVVRLKSKKKKRLHFGQRPCPAQTKKSTSRP